MKPLGRDRAIRIWQNLATSQLRFPGPPAAERPVGRCAKGWVSPFAPFAPADLVIEWRGIDGPSGTLAWMELPGVDTTTPRKGRADADENWYTGTDLRGETNGEVSLLKVMIHEVGHHLGIGHYRGSATNNIMQPFHDRGIVELGPWDVDQAVQRYGTRDDDPDDDDDQEADAIRFGDQVVIAGTIERAA